MAQTIKFRTAEEIGQLNELDDILFTDTLSTKSLLDFCLNKKVNHIVQKANVNPQLELSVSFKMVQNPKDFLNFPLSTLILCPDICDLDTENSLRRVYCEVDRADQKQEVMDQIAGFLKNNSNSVPLNSDILNVADELFTNAIFNAPYQNADNKVVNSEAALVDRNKKPFLFLSNDFDRIILGCCDQYGSADISAILGQIKKCYENSVVDISKPSSENTGISFYFALEKSTSVYIAVQNKVRTLICCSFPLKCSTEKRAQMPKNLHLCQL